MHRTQRIGEQLVALAAYLAGRREAILRAWRSAVDADPELTTASSLPRTQFYDHIPDVLDAFELKVHSANSGKDAPSKAEQEEDAAAHGLQRWQQGYHLREVTREWGHLHLCLVEELEAYSLAHPSLEAGVMHVARRALAELCSEGVSASAAQYFHLQQIEAGGHVRDLNEALDELRELERRRAELWREAAHDLRGNLSVVANATTGLTSSGVPEPMRDSLLQLLQKSVSSLHSMLEDVTDLARLQAGHEQRIVKRFNAAALLGQLCENLIPLAQQRGLYLKTEGATTLLVEGDDVKTRRITQNLVLNALKYTQQGGVTISWGDSRKNDPERWMLCVQDTGPGFHAGPGAQLAGALEEATEEAHKVDEAGVEKGGEFGSENIVPPPTSSPDRRPIHQEVGEGIGLSIVKRLCELLDAAVEVESEPGRGTTFRVVLPRRYTTGEKATAAALREKLEPARPTSP
jgi:signal transduction histidine kinase